MEQVINLQFLRQDGKRERTKLLHRTVADARALEESVFSKSNGLYTEVDICTASGHVETLQNLHSSLADLRKSKQGGPLTRPPDAQNLANTGSLSEPTRPICARGS